MSTAAFEVIKAANPDFDASKLSYMLMQPPQIYPKLELPAPVQYAAPPVSGQTQTSYNIQLTAEQHARVLQLISDPVPKQELSVRKKRVPRPSIVQRIKDRLVIIGESLPEFVGFEAYADEEDDSYEDLDYDPIDSRQASVALASPLYGEPTYASRYPSATAPPAGPPSGPPPASLFRPISTPQPIATAPLAVGLYQKIAQRCPVANLKADRVSVADLQAADVKVLDLRKAGYNLDEVSQLVPDLGFLIKMGMDRSMLDEKWRIPVLADAYKLSVSDVCNRFNLTIADLQRSGMTLDQISDSGFTMSKLISMGADYYFIRWLGHGPAAVSTKLKCTQEDLSLLGFSRDQKLSLSRELKWTATSMIGCFGLSPATASTEWLPLRDEDLFGTQHHNPQQGIYGRYRWKH